VAGGAGFWHLHVQLEELAGSHRVIAVREDRPLAPVEVDHVPDDGEPVVPGALPVRGAVVAPPRGREREFHEVVPEVLPVQVRKAVVPPVVLQLFCAQA